MGLKDILNTFVNVANEVIEESIAFKIRYIAADAEVYKLTGEKEIYELMKKRCVENYNALTIPELKKEVEAVINSYLLEASSKKP